MAKKPERRPVDAHHVHTELVEIALLMGLTLPPELDRTVPEAWEPPKSLPPTQIDRWARRISIFEQMLIRAQGSNPSSTLTTLLEKIRDKVLEVRQMRYDEAREQDKLEIIEAREREGRQRFGFAADALGVDVSRARNDARQAHLDAASAASHSALHSSRLRQIQATMRQLEQAAVPGSPYPALAACYRQAADEIDAWQTTLGESAELRQQADQADRVVVDLEYQIQELRAGLARLEESSGRERIQVEARVVELGQRAEALQNELLQLATDFVGPLRGYPALAPMFRDLEADA